jgi:DNA polymerase/3'-5' exonuclease PolX
MELLKAQQYATEALRALKPYCHQIQIAGSIRRRKPEVKDIEIVCNPIRVFQQDLFGNSGDPVPVKDFCDTVLDWKGIKGSPEGKYTQRELDDGVYLDLFIVTEANWGNQLLIWTGCKDFSAWVMGKRVKEVGMRQQNGYLWSGSDRIPVPTEALMFSLLDLKFIPPKYRNSQYRDVWQKAIITQRSDHATRV